MAKEPWMNSDVALVSAGIIPCDRTYNAVKVFCMRHGLSTPNRARSEMLVRALLAEVRKLEKAGL